MNLFLIRGLPGSGKTSVGESLAQSTKGVCFSADDYFYLNGPTKGGYDFDASKLFYAHKQCVDNTETAMVLPVENVFVTNTFTTEKELKPYYELADKYGYKVFSLITENRHGNSSIHSVPDETMVKMKKRFNVKL